MHGNPVRYGDPTGNSSSGGSLQTLELNSADLANTQPQTLLLTDQNMGQLFLTGNDCPSCHGSSGGANGFAGTGIDSTTQLKLDSYLDSLSKADSTQSSLSQQSSSAATTKSYDSLGALADGEGPAMAQQQCILSCHGNAMDFDQPKNYDFQGNPFEAPAAISPTPLGEIFDVMAAGHDAWNFKWSSAGISMAAVAVPGLSVVKAGDRVGLDANALMRAIDHGEMRTLDKAINGRIPVVSRQAVREYLTKGDKQRLRAFLSERNAIVGKSATSLEVSKLQKSNSLKGKLKIGDARVAGSAQKEGVSVITRDRKFANRLNELGIGAEGF